MILAICLIVSNCTLLFSQTSDHKVYKGKYDIDMNNFYTGDCEYEYEQTPSGRIFDGYFKWKSDYDDSDVYHRVLRIDGNFKNDIQVGSWEWERILIDNRRDVYKRYECFRKLNFNNKGVLDGNFEIRDLHIPGTNTSYFDISGTFKNGKLTSVDFKSANYRVEDAKWTTSGVPYGTWKISQYDKWNGWTHYDMQLDENGKVIKCGYRDSSTGDWIDKYADGPYESRQLKIKIRDVINSKAYIMRSTKYLKIDNM